MHAVRTTRAYAAKINRPLEIETGANYLKPHASEMSDGSFITAGRRRSRLRDTSRPAQCLDQRAERKTERSRPGAELPLDRVWEVHLAGGEERNGYWIDSHCGRSGAAPEACGPGHSASSQPRRDHAGGLSGLSAQADVRRSAFRDRQLARDVDRRSLRTRRAPTIRASSPPPPGLPTVPAPRVAEWEQALAEGMLQRPTTTEIGSQLTTDPAIALYNELLGEFRASMVGTAFGLTTRLLLLYLGKQGMRDLLAKFWLTAPPEMSAAAEAVQFENFLLARGPSIPLLKEMTSFEMAAAYSVMTNESQTVEIDCDIRLAIDALVDGRRPSPPARHRSGSSSIRRPVAASCPTMPSLSKLGAFQEGPMPDMTDTAMKFFEACEAGKGWRPARPGARRTRRSRARRSRSSEVQSPQAYADWMQGLIPDDAGRPLRAEIVRRSNESAATSRPTPCSRAPIPAPAGRRRPAGARVGLRLQHALRRRKRSAT